MSKRTQIRLCPRVAWGSFVGTDLSYGYTCDFCSVLATEPVQFLVIIPCSHINLNPSPNPNPNQRFICHVLTLMD